MTNFFTEGLNVLAGLIFGGLGFVITNIIAAADVASGSISAATATYASTIVFALLFAGCIFGNLGGQMYASRNASPSNGPPA